MLKRNKLLSAVAIASLLAATNASARPLFIPGIYAGGDVGYGTIHQTGFPQSDIATFSNNRINLGPIQTTHTWSSNGTAGRIFVGYQIVPYFGIETGYTKFSNTDLNTASNGTDYTFLPNTASLTGTIKTYAVDLIGKLSVPLGEQGVILFGTLGGAYLNENSTISGGNSDGLTFFQPYTTTTAKVLPTFGAGLAYAFNTQSTVDFTWSHIQNMGNTQLQNTDFWGIGFTYHTGL